MSLHKSLIKKRYAIQRGFYKLGFRGRTAFFNVCKSIDVTLSDFELLNFYDHGKSSPGLVTRLEEILDTLQYE
ncbi:hypothetical protein OD91_0883 [Lutibacter sp. Hel_I_33_5]|uniref:hypothetical protein n=1 Tax=Lutibacter sp. Hel_I_33_5 TaxID=1566289 RepID=UPI00119E754E|nr:hypothetical protein [Lutibacter sp. Hel_I_33_5]TVZ55628.1 hypothetical protein OD91_0883 [Lutibacter sp. Hel_I_33_5]